MNKDTSDDTGNTNTATESVCPKGWTLPTTKQIDNNRDITNFHPILGGYYRNSVLTNETAHANWWSSEAYTGTLRYLLHYNVSGLYTNSYYRHIGFYIRCVSEEKTMTDLTYLQDMTGGIAKTMKIRFLIA